MKKILVLMVMMSSVVEAAFAQAGELDSTFGGDGIVETSVGSYDLAYAQSIAIQADGKIVAAGYDNEDLNADFVVVRYLTNGILDSSFGGNGIVITSISSNYYNYDQAEAIAIQADGKIIAAGYSLGSSYRSFALVRYNTNGTLDHSFSLDGKVTTGFTSVDAVANSVAIQPDGKIVAAGSINLDDGFALVRYNADGTLDSSFNANGKIITYVGPNSRCSSVAIQQDGKIVAAGYSRPLTYKVFALVRYNSDATLDSSFNSIGVVTTTIDSLWQEIYSVIIQPDGKIVAAGFSAITTNGDFALTRYNTNGTLDSTFDTDGIVTTDFNSNSDCPFSVAMQPDGKIIAAGYAYGSPHKAIALARYNTDGSLDNYFGSGGKVTTEIINTNEAHSVAVQADGKIVAGGFTISSQGDHFAIVRYLSDLALGEIYFSSSQSSPLIYPNPIHQTENLEYTLTKNESLTIALYDVNGKLIRNFISNEQRKAGEHKETLNIGELSSGNYFLTLSNGSQKMTVKMVKQ